jgi:hypothetical protein
LTHPLDNSSNPWHNVLWKFGPFLLRTLITGRFQMPLDFPLGTSPFKVFVANFSRESVAAWLRSKDPSERLPAGYGSPDACPLATYFREHGFEVSMGGTSFFYAADSATSLLAQASLIPLDVSDALDNWHTWAGPASDHTAPTVGELLPFFEAA